MAVGSIHSKYEDTHERSRVVCRHRLESQHRLERKDGSRMHKKSGTDSMMVLIQEPDAGIYQLAAIRSNDELSADTELPTLESAWGLYAG